MWAFLCWGSELKINIFSLIKLRCRYGFSAFFVLGRFLWSRGRSGLYFSVNSLVKHLKLFLVTQEISKEIKNQWISFSVWALSKSPFYMSKDLNHQKDFLELPTKKDSLFNFLHNLKIRYSRWKSSSTKNVIILCIYFRFIYSLNKENKNKIGKWKISRTPITFLAICTGCSSILWAYLSRQLEETLSF